MTNTAPGWDLYRSFLGVLRRGSLSAAARELGLTQPTLGRHIEALEAALGLPLFVRSQSGLAPTEGALDLQPHAEAMESAAAALVRASSGTQDEPKGSVRLTASEVVGVEVLPPILAEFQSAHPGIAIELALSNLNQDLSRRDADIAVRMARPTQGALVARRIGTAPVRLFAHRDYLARRGVPRGLADLAGHAIIGFDRDTFALRVLKDTGVPMTREVFALRTDSEHAQLAALRSGFGIGGCQVGIAARDPDLVMVFPDMFRYELEMWLAMHEDLRSSRRVRLLFDHLAQALARYVAIRPGKPGSGGGGQGVGDGLYPRTLRSPQKRESRRSA